MHAREIREKLEENEIKKKKERKILDINDKGIRETINDFFQFYLWINFTK